MNAAVKPKKRAVGSTLTRRLELCKQYLMLPKAQRKPDDFAAKNGVNTNTFKDWIRKYKQEQRSPNAQQLHSRRRRGRSASASGATSNWSGC